MNSNLSYLHKIIEENFGKSKDKTIQKQSKIAKNDLIQSFINDENMLPHCNSTTKDSESNSESSENVENIFVNLIKKKIISSIYSEITQKLLNTEIQQKIMSEFNLDQIVNFFESPSDRSTDYLGKKKRRITDCPHIDRKHYAKNMCGSCYHGIERKRRLRRRKHSGNSYLNINRLQ
jgi:hypothetical protein